MNSCGFKRVYNDLRMKAKRRVGVVEYWSSDADCELQFVKHFFPAENSGMSEHQRGACVLLCSTRGRLCQPDLQLSSVFQSVMGFSPPIVINSDAPWKNKKPHRNAVCNSSYERLRNRWNPIDCFRLPVKACRP